MSVRMERPGGRGSALKRLRKILGTPFCVALILSLTGMTPLFAADYSMQMLEKSSFNKVDLCAPTKPLPGGLRAGLQKIRSGQSSQSADVTPAVALALALGVRNAAGPLEKSGNPVAR